MMLVDMSRYGLSCSKSLVHVLAILFGISSWISINGLWTELPLLVKDLPEGWDLPAYLSIIIQIGNIGPLVYSLVRSKISVTPPIYVLLGIGIVASFGIVHLWKETMIIGGNPQSVGLFACVLFLSLVDCGSSVLYFPYMGRFKKAYLNSYMIGEGLSGFIPSLVALAQGLVLNSSKEPNFSVESFFYVLFAMVVVSFLSFLLLEFSTCAKNEQIDPENTRIIEENVDNGAVDRTVQEEHGIGRKNLVVLLILQCFLSFFSNGALPSIQTYSCLPYGAVIFSSVVIIGPIIGPSVAFASHFISFKSAKVVCSLTLVGSLIMIIIFASALKSPEVLFDSSAGFIIAASWILNGILFSYSKVLIAGICRLTKNSNTLFWYGAVTQIGSSFGALTMFLLVTVFKVFKAE